MGASDSAIVRAESNRWLALERRTPRQRTLYAALAAAPIVLLVPLSGQLALLLLPELPTWVRLGLSLGVALVVAGVTVGIMMLRTRVPKVDLERGLLRMGAREVPFAAINRAQVLRLNSSRRRRSFAISFGPDGGPTAIVTLRSKTGPMLDREQTDRLVTVLKRSSIEMPKDPNDPQGRFARYNFPKNIDRAAAIALVRDPPEPGEALPIPGFGAAKSP